MSEHVHAVIHDILLSFGVNPTDQQIINLCTHLDELIVEDIYAWEGDTVSREAFTDELSTKLTGLKWPTYGNDNEYKEKHKRLLELSRGMLEDFLTSKKH